MSTIQTTSTAAGGDPAASPAPANTRSASSVSLYLTRGVIAVAWAIVFSTISDSLTTTAAILLVVYPLIDVVGSLIDSRRLRDARARQLQRLNAATSALAAVALAIAATGTQADVVHVFGIWAVVSGAAQVSVAIRHRTQVIRTQWPMLIAGGLSVLVGVTFNVSDPHVSKLVIYAVGGGVWFTLQAGLLARRHSPIRPS